ncbi:MAG: hypothetical protein ACYC3S_07655 [Chloroflexota bacterium]
MLRSVRSAHPLVPRLLAVGATLWLTLAGCAAPPATGTPTGPVATVAPQDPGTLTVTGVTTSGISTHPDRPAVPPARAMRGGPSVRLAPDDDSPLISGLYFDTPLALLEERTTPNGTRWFRTRLWGVVDGWIRADQVTFESGPPARPFYESQTPSGRPSPVPAPSRALAATGATNAEVMLRRGPGTDYRALGALGAGEPIQVQAWAVDDDGRAWFDVASAELSGWVYGGAVDLAFADPQRPAVDGRPLASFVAGKGMWLPQALVEMADERQLVQAAVALGLTHIFVEAGDSRSGFYARKEVARLLPVAHAAGLRVLAWVTTSLYDLPRDVELSVEIANYRTPDGQRLDGLAPDIEQNMALDAVKAYAEITRVRVGDDVALVGVVYPAGGWFGREYPVFAPLARAFNALAPMAYWSDKERPYTYAEVYAYVRDVAADMQAAVRPGYPVHVIGQMYDTFGRNGTGLYSPGRAEVNAALQAGRDGGALGVSFFQWGTATPEEWGALRDFAW